MGKRGRKCGAEPGEGIGCNLKLAGKMEVRMRASARRPGGLSGLSGPDGRGRGEFLKLLAMAMIAAVAGRAGGAEAQAQDAGDAGAPAGDCSGLRVIQGRITAIDGSVVTVKTPDGYPGGPGVHAQFVLRGPEFRVDISASRILLPDGKQDDRQPLAVGERVVAVLSQTKASGAAAPAAIVERVSASDRVATH
jgi:hypothetical protein